MSDTASSVPRWPGIGAEVELLSIVSRLPLTPRRARDAERVIAGGVDWEKVLASAAGWQTEPVVMTNLLELGSSVVPADRIDAIEAVRTSSRVLALLNALKAIQVVLLLAEKGIPAIVLKGPAVGFAGYGDPSFRASNDVDLLVRPEQIRKARKHLVTSGYSIDYDEGREDSILAAGHALELSAQWVRVELHPFLLPKHMRWEIGNDKLWRESRAIECGGSEIQVLSPAHNFLFLCAHGAKHKWPSWRWLCDIAQIAERLSDDDRREVVVLAAVTNARRILSLAIHVVTEVFGDVSHGFAVADLEPRRTTWPLVETILRGLSASPNSAEAPLLHRVDLGLDLLVFWARTRERLADRVLPVAGVLFLPTDQDDWAGPLKWIQRPVRLATRAMRSFAKYA